MTPREPTYDCFALHMIMPAPGWHAVHYDDAGHHFLIAIATLALVNRRLYTYETRRLVPDLLTRPEDECREIVGLAYTPADGFAVCETSSTYCGLLPPEWTLDEFTTTRECGHLPPVTPTAMREGGV